MSTAKKLVPIKSGLIHNLFSQIPAKDVQAILSPKKAVISTSGDHVRMQVSISIETFVVLKYWSAFEAVGESGFFGNLAIDYIHKYIMRDLGIMKSPSAIREDNANA